MTVVAPSFNHSKYKYYLETIYVLIALYAICYQLQRPIEPFLVDRLVYNTNNEGDDGSSTSSSQQTYGNLQTLFNVCQMIGSLLFGTIVDQFGIRVGFLVNFIASAGSYYLLSQATTIHYLYMSKIPGMFMAGFLVGQTACVKCVQINSKEGNDSNARIKVLGRLTASYTVGAMVGPFIGGFLGAHGDYYFGAKLACMGSLLCAALAWFALPDLEQIQSTPGYTRQTSTSSDTNNMEQTSSTQKWSFWGRYYKAIQISGVFLSIKVITSVANSMASTAQPLILKNQLGVSEKGLGMFMSFSFCVGGLVNGFGLDKLTKVLGSPSFLSSKKNINTGGNPRLVVKHTVFGMFVFYSCLAFIYSSIGISTMEAFILLTNTQKYFDIIKQIPFISLTLLLSILQFTLSTSITAETTSLVPKEIRGTMVSLEHSLFSAPRIVAPSIGVAVYRMGDISGLCISCALIFLSVSFCWNRFIDIPTFTK